MSYNIATYLIPALIGFILFVVVKRRLRMTYTTTFLLYSFLLSYYYLLLYFLTREKIWDTSWAFYSVGFIVLLSLLIGLILLIIQQIKSFK
ncbi:hypothetical protein SAMN05421877_102112 [Sphingobacterium lactis]|uniref:Uncharacterized protein n=1 Tax=Sphingobacterium lactis TaxID=797291 RepID=A0A1H5TXQ0_9SPHI|nr:hypothetical protein SAMN05421877_102112 [Sphingobacterium lactis]